jgi:N-acetylglucosamine-6-phosphate deacetylase
MYSITGDIVTPDNVLSNSVMTVADDGRIGDIGPTRPLSTRSGDIDAAGLLVLPGFIDLHVHGGGGADFMHGTTDAGRQVARTHARFGTTGLLATTLTASREGTDRAISAARDVQLTGPGEGEARIFGIHLEGPYICPTRRGAQPAEWVREPNPEELAHWIKLSENTIRQITLAPERDGAEAVIQLARANGIIASLGHTDATAAEAERAISWGATQATHVFNAMRGLHHREPGMAGVALAHPEVICEVIADGIHLDPLIVRLIIAAKGVSGVVLITDAIEGTAMPEGQYSLGGQTVIVKSGTAAFADGTLAGSVLTMNRAFANIRRFAGVSVPDAARLSSANAARQLGLAGKFGELTAGAAADIVIMHPESGEVYWTLVGGRVVYRR